MENRLTETQQRHSDSVERLSQRNERVSTALELMKFDSGNHGQNMGTLLQRITEIREVVRNHEQEVREASERDRRARDEELRSMRDGIISEQERVLASLEFKITDRLAQESLAREESIASICANVQQTVQNAQRASVPSLNAAAVVDTPVWTPSSTRVLSPDDVPAPTALASRSPSFNFKVASAPMSAELPIGGRPPLTPTLTPGSVQAAVAQPGTAMALQAIPQLPAQPAQQSNVVSYELQPAQRTFSQPAGTGSMLPVSHTSIRPEGGVFVQGGMVAVASMPSTQVHHTQHQRPPMARCSCGGWRPRSTSPLTQAVRELGPCPPPPRPQHRGRSRTMTLKEALHWWHNRWRSWVVPVAAAAQTPTLSMKAAPSARA
eukprot:NODE_6164_length_1699_cov_4.912850.p1 GENE.NODE_6164_length_1699_cov_4.912850~~NODE_6164_length_1699_cov_4.912850.p1  ORF type:complete len:378 (-),score=89.40 NODE_6164_length_1699_cov_4.912850:566-1699(-)